ncbi:Abhydrolase_3 domain-containing protein [Pseudozyma hubeiensis]|nr:Abhydrolase_3 domain-containing protein [Pseudozyma hubeiensis]
MSSISPQTYTYKTFVNTDGEQTSIPVDVYIPKTVAQTQLTPVVWVHTGGFLQGTRKFVPPHFLRALAKHNLALVAPDFRLCPQVSIFQVLEDVADCIRWTLDPVARSASGFTSDSVSSERYILGGSSAGGWPALLLGLALHDEAKRIPRLPSAVFAIYAITTVTQDLAPFFYEPQKPLSWAADGKLIDRQPLESEGHLTKCLDAQHQLLKSSSAKIRIEAPPASNPVRAALYNFARQEAIYPSLILQDPSESSRVCTPTLIKTKSKGTAVPVLIAYGDSDPKVPHSQSLHVVDALKTVGYDDRNLLVIEEKGADHLFDMEPEKEVDGMWTWLAKQL